MHLVQWNVNGFYARLPYIQILKKKFSPGILCLQETNFKNFECGQLRGYTATYKNRSNAAHASGGVATFVKENIPCEEILLITPLEAVAISVSIPQKLTICNVYLPNSYNLKKRELHNLVQQLPKPFIVVGDFNSHNPQWGSSRTDQRGNIVEKFIDEANLVILNTGESTHFNPSSGSLSSIDLSLCSADLTDKLDWVVDDDIFDSDHFPMHINIYDNSPGINKNKNSNSNLHMPRWKFKNANWPLYTDVIDETINETPPRIGDEISDINTELELFMTVIRSAADKAIPKSKGNSSKRGVPWWNDECEITNREAKHAFNVFKKHKTLENKIEYKKRRAIARRTIKTRKRDSWRSFISSINQSTPSDAAWRAINRIQGRKSSSIAAFLVTDDGVTKDSHDDMANLLANTFAENSSDANYSSEFLELKKETEAALEHTDTLMSAPTENEDKINSLFTLRELQAALASCKNSSPGPDGIPSILIKNLPMSGLRWLLALYNYMWEKELFPNSWRLATVIPIPKPGKDPTVPSNYRPISLTCNLCKIWEKMVNTRLRWSLESKGWISQYQSGFRQFRSTTDHLVQFEANVCNAFIDNCHLIAVSMDIEKAYEMAWKARIIQILADQGFKGKIITYVNNFLKDRYIQVRLGNTLSETKNLANGLPQGSVLSVTLFMVAINGILSPLRAPVKGLLFADDLTVFCSGKNLRNTHNLIQEALNDLIKWSNCSGFKFSQPKTEYMIFSRMHSQDENSTALFLGNHKLRRTFELKILGMTFNPSLSWKTHIKLLKAQCQRRMNIIKSLASKNWGADRHTLLNTYRAIVRAKLDYGAIIYGSAAENLTHSLDPIQTTALRLAIGAFRTSPNKSVMVEAGEPPLLLRRKTQAIAYLTRYRGLAHMEPYETAASPIRVSRYLDRPGLPRPYAVRVSVYAQELRYKIPETHSRRISPFPPWDPPTVHIDLDMMENSKNKSNTPPTYYRNKHDSIVEKKYSNHVQLFTDGSIINNQRGCSVIFEEAELTFKLPSAFSIFSCELFAIDQALTILDNSHIDKAVIFTDSMSALVALQNGNATNTRLQTIQQKIVDIQASGREVVLSWVPSHVGISGNEKADSAAKRAPFTGLSSSIVTPLGQQELKKEIYQAAMSVWNETWQTSEISKLHSIRDNIYDKQPMMNNRRDQSVMTRLRIGHSNLTHCYLFDHSQKPYCQVCNVEISIEHLIAWCPSHQQTRASLGLPTSFKQCFANNEALNTLLKFCKSIDIYNKV